MARRSKSFSAAALLLVTAFAPLQAQRGAADPERAAARQVVQELGANLQDGNWARADSLFAPRGLHVLVDTLALHSWAEYRDKHLKPMLAQFPGAKVAHTAVEAVVRGSVAWVAFRQEVSGSGSSAPSPRVTRGTAVLEKLNERWTIVHYHVSR